MKKLRLIMMSMSCLLMVACSTTSGSSTEDSVSTAKETTTVEKEHNSETSQKLQKDDVEGDKNMEENVTREWLKEQYNYSEEDLDGINVEDIAASLLWTRAKVVSQYGDNSTRLLSVLKSSQEQWNILHGEKKNTMLSNPLWSQGAEGELPDFKDLKTIEMRGLITDEEYYRELTGYVDVDAKTIYFADGEDVAFSVNDNRQEDYQMYALSEEELQTILDGIDRQYLNQPLDMNNPSIWMIAFEYQDGTIYNYALDRANSDEGILSMIKTFFGKMGDTVEKDSLFKFIEE